MKLPEIRIKNGWHLDDALRGLYEEIPESIIKEKGYSIQTKEEVVEKIPLYEAEWKKYESKVLQAMSDILELEFYKTVLDVYVVGAYKAAFSTPLVMSAKYRPDMFIDVLTHELIHVLLTDNDKNIKVREIWNKMFPEAINITSRNHILVHAVHKEIYLKYLEAPERLERDLKKCEKRPGYADAWKIVNERGHMNIIEEFKTHYAD